MINIEKIVNKSIADRQEEEKKKHSEYTGLITASMLGQCHRRQFYSIMKIEQSNPPGGRSLRVFACGNVFHQFVQDIAKENKNHFIESAYKDDTFSVRADMVTDDAVYELKSQHSKKFWYIQEEIKKGKTIFDFQPEHVLQVGLCAILFKKEWACIVYISKDDLCIKQFSMKTEEIKPLVDKEIEEIKSILKSGILPPPDPRLYGKDKKTGKPKECEYCSWKDRCFNEREV